MTMEDSVRITPMRAEDIPAVAALFTAAFEASVLHHCGGQLPRPQAMQDVFRLVYQAEPAAAHIARQDGQVVGYCFSPVRLPGLWWKAVCYGHVWRWAWRWLSGQYGFGLTPLKVIVMNKLTFVRAAAVPQHAANARILSIAVGSAWRGQGIAGRLLAAADVYFAAQRVTRIRLEVRPDNVPAIRLYRRFGYREVGRTHDSQGLWLIMLKETGDAAWKR